MNARSIKITKENGAVSIDAEHIYYRDLNRAIRDEIGNGETSFRLKNVNGHRYIADGICGDVSIDVFGVPGQDLGAFMSGPTVRIHNNAQDGVGNTMDAGKIAVSGMAGDVCGYAMRGGKIHIMRDAGYRIGIHMKEYYDRIPVIIVGGKAGDFFGEYMAGGRLILLGMYSLYQERSIVGNFMGTGMHGGAIYVRGKVDGHRLGKELIETKPSESELRYLEELVFDFARDFDLDANEIMAEPFFKYAPKSHRPYGNLYAY